MTLPVSAPKNDFFDGMAVTVQDLDLEQQYNTAIQSSIIDSHVGSGVLPSALVPHMLFNSSLINNLLDGVVLQSQAQPSDPNNGDQLSVTLSNSKAAGNRSIKVLIIGLDFENSLQYDALTFHTNETQITQKHYTFIVAVVFNDLFGLASQSLNLGGTVIIQEVSPLTLSRDVIMASQTIQPNLFFRDFFVSSGGTILNLLSSALPNYNVNNLNIQIGYSNLRSIVEDDVSSQIGQKFLATTNNIQKVTLLLAIYNDITPTDLVWDGDMLISIYPLQSTVSSPSDIVPGIAIAFDPSNIPVAQLSFTYGSLQANGMVLNATPQPVSFIFSNTTAGSGNSIIPGNYYAVTIKRAGSADTCQIQVATGMNTSTTSWETLFNGSVWTDVPDESIWYEIWSDAAKVSDGQGYDAGQGFIVPKNQINTVTGLEQDYSLGQLQFLRNDVYYALAQATTQQLALVENPKTGNNVYSEQQIVPTISLLNAPGLANLSNVSEPFVVGTITDQNVKTYSLANSIYAASFHEYGIVGNQIVLKVITDQTDGYRYDTSIIDFASALVNGSLNGALFCPGTTNPSTTNPDGYYRVAKAEYLTMLYGDVDGNGIVDDNDLLLAEQLLGYNLNTVPTYDQYISLTTYFINDTGVHWQVVNPVGNIVIASGTDGVLTTNPINGIQTNLHSASASFATIVGIANYIIVLSNSNASLGNNGTFTIFSLVDTHDITVQKQYYTSDVLLQVFRANVSGNMVVNTGDITAITNYIELVEPFPATSAPGNLVGTPFNAIRLTLEEYVDRHDDYPSTGTNRSTTIHPLPDIYLDGYISYEGQDLEFVPLAFSCQQQLVWYETSVVSNSNPRMVETAFNYQTGYIDYTDIVPGAVVSETFPLAPSFDPGRNDIFIPNNLIIGVGGQIIKSDGYVYPIDFEIANFLIEIPSINFNGEQTVNIFNDLVANYSNTGHTRIGYEALRFSDNSFVGMSALSANQVRFGVAVQSLSPQLNGQDPQGIVGIIVDNRIGVSLDFASGLLKLNMNNTYVDPVLQTLNTKIQITIYLKQAGFNNPDVVFMPASTSLNWLGLG
jgi:hypothetical protein